MTANPTIHPQSFRALAYEILGQLNGGKPVSTSSPTIYEIEAEMRHQYGLLLNKDDQDRLKLGQRPDTIRLKTMTIPLTKNTCDSCDKLLRYGTIQDFMSWNGVPYITRLGTCYIPFAHVSNQAFLKSRTKVIGKPAYTIEANTLIVRLTPETALLDSVEVTGILEDPFFGLDRNASELWKEPWIGTEGMKALIKERTEIRLRGGIIATWQRQDKINNGQENPVNNQQ